jgi:hypothetical protein
MSLKRGYVRDQTGLKRALPKLNGHACENKAPFALGGTGTRGTKDIFLIEDKPPQQDGVGVFATESRGSTL